MMDAKKRKQGENIFFALFIPWIALTVLYETTVSYQFSEAADYIAGLLKSTVLPVSLVLFSLFFLSRATTLKKLLALGVVVLLTAQCYLITYNDDLLLCACLVISASAIDFKKILKVYLLVSLAVMAITTIAALAGWIDNISIHNGAVPRYALGCFWCTDYSARAFFLILTVLYLYSRKMKILHWIGLLAAASLVFWPTFGKTDFMCSVLAIVCFYVHETITKKKETCASWDGFWQKISLVITPAAAIVMTVLTLLYQTESGFILKLNDILTRRLEWGYQAFSKIGITIGGQYVKWIGMGGISDDTLPEDYNFVDCSYLHILFAFGILIAIAVILLHCFLAYKNRMDTRFLIVVTFIALNCAIAHHLLDPAYNPFWVALPVGLSDIIGSSNKKDG